MNPFEGLTRLFTSSVDGFAPMDDKFVRPDREATAKSMRLDERGAEQGELNLPPADATDFDVVEREIVAEVAEDLDAAHIDVCNNLRAYEERLSELHLLHGLGAIRAETKKTVSDLKAVVAGWHDRISTQRDAVRGSYKELRSFQEKYGLARPFHKVESRWVHGSVILTAWLGEAAGNTIFLSENNPMGISGGIMAAALVAGLNVLLAVFAGTFVFRRKNLPGASEKAMAWLGIFAWFVITIIWNLAAAHFRDAQAAGVADPPIAAITMFKTDPLNLPSFYSWGMLVVGLLAAVVSAHEAYKMNDPFPGYGDLGLKHIERCDMYADLVAEAREKLAEERDRAVEAAQAVKDELAVQVRARGMIHAAHQHLMRRFKEHHKRMEELANYLLQRYRNANIRARSDPAPTHFKDSFSFPVKELPELHEEPLDKAKIDGAEATLNDGIDAVTKAFDESIDSFTPLEELKKDLEDGAV